MSTETNAVQEITETPLDLAKASRDTFLKLLACSGIGFIIFLFGVKLLVEIFIILGAAIFAGPLVLGLCFGLPIIDIGPVFRAVDTPIGNFIYRTFVPDVSGQMAANLALTLIRAMFMLLLSVAIMPILLIICFIGYRIGRKKALKYAAENDIPSQSVPRISLVVALIYIGVIIAGIIGANVAEAAQDKKYDDQYNEKMQAMTVVFDAFMNDIDNVIPEEYFAEAYKGQNYTGGFVARFKVGDKVVMCGKTQPLPDYPDVLTSSSVYYFIDDTLYIDKYSTSKFTICNDQNVIAILKARIPESHFNKNITLYDGFTGDDYDNQAMESEGGILELIVELVKDVYESRRILHFDENNKLVGYGWYQISLDMTETQFVFTDDTISNSLKEAAGKIIDGTAQINEG